LSTKQTKEKDLQSIAHLRHNNSESSTSSVYKRALGLFPLSTALFYWSLVDKGCRAVDKGKRPTVNRDKIDKGKRALHPLSTKELLVYFLCQELLVFFLCLQLYILCLQNRQRKKTYSQPRQNRQRKTTYSQSHTPDTTTLSRLTVGLFPLSVLGVSFDVCRSLLMCVGLF